MIDLSADIQQALDAAGKHLVDAQTDLERAQAMVKAAGDELQGAFRFACRVSGIDPENVAATVLTDGAVHLRELEPA